MLKRLLLINSANFQFADINLSKEVFFVGENASGKTTTTRALHFLYNGDGHQLGIPRSKDTFLKHYFAHDDSYIIYVFENFFIFTYKRNDNIRRWFSKQNFDLEQVIQNGRLLDFQEIETYIKSAPLFYRPSTIEEYTSILYGANRKYLDFSIAKIENYSTFLNVFNMIFNVDRAIVDANDIKKAIQKSLERKDETLILDHEGFTRKLSSFALSYHFFKTFDASRKPLHRALILKDELLKLEHTIYSTQKAINYRLSIEERELNLKKVEIDNLLKANKKDDFRIDSFERYFTRYKERVDTKRLEPINRDIAKLEILKEKFDPIIIEENIVLAGKYKGINKELDSKKHSLQLLQEKQTTAQKEIERQIETIEHKIKTIIPHETQQAIFRLKGVEQENNNNELLEIEKEFDEIESGLLIKLQTVSQNIEKRTLDKRAILPEIEKEENVIKNDFRIKIDLIEAKKKSDSKNIEDITNQIRDTNSSKKSLEDTLAEHKKKYKALRKSNAHILWDKRIDINSVVSRMEAIAYPPSESFHAFLAEEIDGWEHEIYPIIDKDLLRRTREELAPTVLDSDNILGFRIDTSTLSSIPTQDEALHTIKQKRNEKRELLRNSQEVLKSEKMKYLEKSNELHAEIESCEKMFNNLIDEQAALEANIKKADREIADLHEENKQALAALQEKFLEKKAKIEVDIGRLQADEQKIKGELKNEADNKRRAIENSTKRLKANFEIIRKNEEKKMREAIEAEDINIKKLLDKKKNLEEDEMISVLLSEVTQLEKALNESIRAETFLNEYEKAKESIANLPVLEMRANKISQMRSMRANLVGTLKKLLQDRISKRTAQKTSLEDILKQFSDGIQKLKKYDIKTTEDKLETDTPLTSLIDAFIDDERDYRSKKVEFKEVIHKLKKLETHSFIELHFGLETFDSANSISELGTILDSLNELNKFEKNKYESEKKRSHNNFDSFLRNTIPSKLQTFDDLENEFEKAKASINKNLARADFGVIRDIKLVSDNSRKRHDSIAKLLQDLLRKVKDTVGLYSSKSLFYHDIPKSVDNIQAIQDTLEEIRQRGAAGPINLFDTIDLSISYIENGKKVENKPNIKDDSSSGGNILLKVAIAMSILNRFAKKTFDETPFFLIIDEISKLQSKNQNLLRNYINENGFKTLFITPDPVYPDPTRAIYYTFKNIIEEGGSLEIRQMNIV